MTPDDKETISALLRSKRVVTRLQILVEIAERQPGMRQKEVAAKLGVTRQAISEYIRELVEEGLVSASGYKHYEVTKAGIEWMADNVEALENYIRYIRRDIIQQVSVWTAIAAENLSAGDEVGVFMKDGFLYAGKKMQSATGAVIADAKKDEDVGVARLNGMIEHREGTITICKVPRIKYGGSRRVQTDTLNALIRPGMMVVAVGLEACIALKNAGHSPDQFFGARECVIEAAFNGIDCVIVIVDEEFADFLRRLEGVGLPYGIVELIVP
ncbi:MAG: winged helix-turn-helix transcriptional regulator [Methanoregula sp.]|nr:winged helix-turn-helix transcriptional regulator [Methanoregula sp.]